MIRKLGQPQIIGEIAIGVLVGPSVLGAYLLRSYNITLFDPSLTKSFASLGAIFLLFLVGLESDFRVMYTRKNFAVALGGVLLPFVIGAPLAFYMLPAAAIGDQGTRFTMAAFVGAAMVATSTAIAAAILLELGLMKDRVAQTIIGAAVIDDILGLLTLSIVVGLSRSGGIDIWANIWAIAILLITALVFIGVAIYVGVHFFSKIVVRLQAAGNRMGMKHSGFSIAIAITFLYAFISEVIGLSAIVGAFLAGTMFASTPLRKDLGEGATYRARFSLGFVLIFFISLGVLVDLGSVSSEFYLFSLILVAMAIVTKVVGCSIPARLTGLRTREALAVGLGMTPRGEVGLIVALTALTAEVIGPSLFSVIVLVSVAVSVLPSPFLKRALRRVVAQRARDRAEAPESQANSP